MPEEIDLETYCKEIESLIKEGRSEEAIAAVRHILSFYPKFIEAYRLLGMACLERGDLASAAEVFLRVLSADPENLAAYIGLADIYRAEGKIEQAIWFLEKAIDLEPAHRELKKELENLYREAGIPELISRYTLAGLGRTYIRGGLLEQAVQTLNEALEREPDRVDLRVSLAEVLWRMGKRLEAAQTCLEVLEVLPHCLKANLILGYLWSSINPGEARLKLELAQALDPFNRKAWELFGRDSPLKPRQVRIPKFEVVPAPPREEKVFPALPEIMKVEEELPAFLEEEGLLALPRLEEKAVPEEVAPSGEEELVEVPPWLEEKAPEELPAEELPPWLKGEELLAEEAAGLLGLEEAEYPEELPPWLREELPPSQPEEEAEIPEGIPPWLREELSYLRPEEVTAPEELPAEEISELLWPEEKEAIPPVRPEEAEISEEVLSPPWLEEKVAPPEELPSVELPSWLEEEAAAPEEMPAEEIPPWFREEAAAPEELPAEEISLWPEEKVQPEEAVAGPPEEVALPLVEEEAPAAPEFVPPSWIESLKPLAESFLEGEEEIALAAEAEMAVEELPPLEEKKKPKGAEELLEIARARAKEGAWEEALNYYRKLSRSKKYLEEVGRDLEKALKEGVARRELFELLGDIYREKGLLDQALELYRKAILSF